MDARLQCKRCGGPKPPGLGADALCPRCVLAMGLGAADDTSENLTIAAGEADAPPSARIPARIGHYRIIRLIGEGGMGAVYEAEQDQPRRVVALKVIKPGFASPELLRRFEQEAHALGRLQHPGIAQIYEAGTADAGFGPQPYFAMEYIRGTTLLEYVAQQHPSTSERLELMAKVAEAVHHAHQRGLIHRDLKPGNILVDETGQPKILDFGVARVTDSDAAATLQTDIGQLVGTLAYMSPEQVLADPLELDTRSDVYAMGVILYEVLAARLPHNISKKLHEAVQAIREEDPAKLSSVDRHYRGDIETIAAKALEKDKTRRYGSAAELASDIRRYLTDEPIVARPPSATYQLQKFARRHKTLVGGAAAVLAVLVAGVVVSTWQAVRASRAEKTAVEQRLITIWRSLARESARDAATRVDDDRAALLAVQALRTHANTPNLPRYLVEDALQQAIRLTQWSHILPLVRLEGARNALAIIGSIAFSSDRRYLAASSVDGIWLWDVRKPADAPVLIPGHRAPTIAFAPDGTRLAVNGESGMQLLDLRNPGAPALPLRTSAPGGTTAGGLSPVGGFLPVAVSPDGFRVASGGAGLSVWDLRRPSDPAVVIEGHRGAVISVAFSPDGRRLISGGVDRTAQLWDLDDTATPRAVFQFPGLVTAVAFSPDGQQAASADTAVRFWDLSKNDGVPPPLRSGAPGVSIQARSLSFSPDGRHLASGGSSGVMVWDVRSPASAPIQLGRQTAVLSVVFSPDGRHLASAGDSEAVQVWDWNSPGPASVFDIPRGYERVVPSPDASHMAYVANDKSISLQDMRNPASPLRVVRGIQGDVKAVSPGGTKVAATNRDSRAVSIWHLRNPQNSPVTIERASGAPIVSVAFSRDGMSLVIENGDETEVWNLGDPGKRPLRLIHGATTENRPLLLPDGVHLLTSVRGGNQRVRLWDLRNAGAPALLLPGSEGVDATALSPDGSRLAAGGLSIYKEDSVRVWDLRTPESSPIVLPFVHENQPQGPPLPIRWLRFSPDGTMLAAGGVDRTVRLWNLMNPSAAPVLLDVPGTPLAFGAPFSTDGTRLSLFSGPLDSETGALKSLNVTALPLWSEAADYLCTRVWRNLSLDEWKVYVGEGIPYERTCPRLPAGR